MCSPLLGSDSDSFAWNNLKSGGLGSCRRGIVTFQHCGLSGMSRLGKLCRMDDLSTRMKPGAFLQALAVWVYSETLQVYTGIRDRLGKRIWSEGYDRLKAWGSRITWTIELWRPPQPLISTVETIRGFEYLEMWVNCQFSYKRKILNYAIKDEFRRGRKLRSDYQRADLNRCSFMNIVQPEPVRHYKFNLLSAPTERRKTWERTRRQAAAQISSEVD